MFFTLYRFLIFWNSIGVYMKNSWLFPLLKAKRVSMRSLLVGFIQHPLRLHNTMSFYVNFVIVFCAKCLRRNLIVVFPMWF